MSNISKDLLTNSNSSSALIRLQCSDSVDVNSTEYQNSAISTSCSDINMENSENQKFNAKQNKRIHEHKVNLNSSQILSIYQQENGRYILNKLIFHMFHHNIMKQLDFFQDLQLNPL